MQNTSTIVAISTPSGTGGIAVIRVSGQDAIRNCNTIFVPKKKNTSLLLQQPTTVSFGIIVNHDGEVIDEVLLSIFHSPHSFTGEDIVEISCHGSVYIQQQILQLLLQQNCVLAQPGEFTQRAFLNGKIDLSQAESVADLIASSSKASHRMAMNQMRGGFSIELSRLRTHLLQFVSLVELELDFSEEDVQFADRSHLYSLAHEIQGLIKKLADSFSIGNVLKQGIPVAIIGETNVGKSTLLNVMLNEERAIVSEIHGTTRDVIEDAVVIGGVVFRIIDTAGIRQTTDTIENLGILRTYEKIDQASIVIWMLDCSAISEHMEWLTEKILNRAQGKKMILVFNKVDKIGAEEREILSQLFEPLDCERIYISARDRLHTENLNELLVKLAQIPELSNDEVIVSNVRHFESLTQAHSAICRVIDGLEANISCDFLSQDIRDCMHHLGVITGQISNDEILGNIFGKFCIGK